MKRLLDSIIKINYLFYKTTNVQVFILFLKKNILQLKFNG